jgi:hypothetical protein
MCEIANGGMQCVFRSFLEINTVSHPVFDLSIRGQVHEWTTNVSVILTVPNAVFWVKACNEIGDRVLMSLCYLDLNANILVFFFFTFLRPFSSVFSVYFTIWHIHASREHLFCAWLC